MFFEMTKSSCVSRSFSFLCYTDADGSLENLVLSKLDINKSKSKTELHTYDMINREECDLVNAKAVGLRNHHYYQNCDFQSSE